MAAQEWNTHNRLQHRGSGLGEGSSAGGAPGSLPFAGESEAECASSKTAGPQTHAGLPL